MVQVLKKRLKALYYDEKGVALAFTVVVFLFLYLFGMGIYAAGNTVQKRIRLQNAADAAAYSGAVIQADTLSRIAVINKAMAWTYVMETRMQMDYIVHKWLGNTIKTWDIMDQIVRTINGPSCCNQHRRGIDYYAGSVLRHGWIRLSPYGKDVNIRTIRVKHQGMSAHLSGQRIYNAADNAQTGNPNETFKNFEKDYAKRFDDILKNDDIDKSDQQEMKKNVQNLLNEDLGCQFSGTEDTNKLTYGSSISNTFFSGIGGIDAAGQRLGKQIDNAKSNIKAMNKASTTLRDQLKNRVELAIRTAMEKNYPGADYRTQVSSADAYMAQLKSSDERHFLDFASEFAGKSVKSSQVMNKGADKWMNITSTADGISRGYTSGLIAQWSNFARLWIHVHYSHFCIPFYLPPTIIDANYFTDSFYRGEPAKPLVLTHDYFKPKGAIVVAASVPLVNPFADWGDVSRGLFSAFTVGGGNQKIMAVSAARAGYRDSSEAWGTGSYCNLRSCDGRGNYIDEAWNLREADWDALFLPVNDKTVISASDFEKLSREIWKTGFIPNKNSKNSKINYQEALKHVFH